jgi:acyl-coenzyme A synthetase/AMP-(fatty) acid ligase
VRDLNNRPWLISSPGIRAITYAELCVRLRSSVVRYCPWCRPISVEDALWNIVCALVFETDLTLFDSNWSDFEVEALGISRTRLLDVLERPGCSYLEPTDLAAKVNASSAARIGLFSSGSSGRPTLTRHSLVSLTRGVKVGTSHCEDVWAFAYNPAHIAGVQVFLQAISNLNALVNVAGLDRTAILSTFRRYGISHVSATPTFYRLLLPCEQPLDRVRGVSLGGEGFDAVLYDSLRELFPSARLRNIYATTEVGSLLVSNGEIFAVPLALGSAITVQDGRLHVHRRLMAEFRCSWVNGDWYDTGDRVEIIEERPLRFRFLGRERDWVNVGGIKVNPLEVEALLDGHPAVVGSRVLGRKNSVSGQILYAEVVARDPSITEVDLRDYLGTHLHAAKIPRVIRFVDRIKETRSGKRLRL